MSKDVAHYTRANKRTEAGSADAFYVVETTSSERPVDGGTYVICQHVCWLTSDPLNKVTLPTNGARDKWIAQMIEQP